MGRQVLLAFILVIFGFALGFGVKSLTIPPPPLLCGEFLRGTSITDLRPGSNVEVRWWVKNCGNTTWTGYKLMRISLESPERLDQDLLVSSGRVPALRPGEQGEIVLPIRIPNKSGRYRADYMLANEKGELFKPIFTIPIDLLESFGS